jgi:Flp pilus assembly protein TadG
MKRRSAFRLFRRHDRGIAAIEFAIIAPVVIFLAAATLEFGAYYRALDGVNKLASQYAISWSDCSDDASASCGTEGTSYTSGSLATNLAPSLVAASVSVRLFQVRIESGSVKTVYARPTGIALDANERAALLDRLEDGDAGVVVTVAYTHTLQFFADMLTSTLGPYLSMKARVVQLK